MNVSEITPILINNGWKRVSDTDKVICFENVELDTQNRFLYLKAEIRKQPLVIHPCNKDIIQEIIAIVGLDVNSPDIFRRLSNFSKFPKQMFKGNEPTNFGIAIGLETPKALSELLDLLCNKPAEMLVADLQKIETLSILETEKNALRQARIGQGKFRRQLIEEFGSKCALTGITMLEVLVASHIKPWRNSDNAERLNPKNGFLFAPHVDALFDKGYISFTDAGELLHSSRFTNEEIEKFRLPKSLANGYLDDSRKSFLHVHQNEVFVE